MLGSGGGSQYGQFPGTGQQLGPGSANTASALAALGQAASMGGGMQALQGNFATLANLQAAGR